jgi:hypothetical protein
LTLYITPVIYLYFEKLGMRKDEKLGVRGEKKLEIESVQK